MAIYGVVLERDDVPNATPVHELNEELWVEPKMLAAQEQGIVRSLVVCNSLDQFNDAIGHAKCISAVSSTGDGVWGPINADFVRAHFERGDSNVQK